MSLTKQWLVCVVAGLMVAAAAANKDAPVRFESGGSTYEDVDAMNARAGQYSFKLTLAAKHSGAYLADVDVKIVSLPDRTPVLEHKTEGPLLLAALPPGRYEVTARYSDVLPGAATSLTRNVVVPRSGNAQLVIYFDTGD